MVTIATIGRKGEVKWRRMVQASLNMLNKDDNRQPDITCLSVYIPSRASSLTRPYPQSQELPGAISEQ